MRYNLTPNTAKLPWQWRNHWQSESKLVDTDGEEVARVQSFEDGWRTFVEGRRIGEAQRNRDTAQRWVEGFVREALRGIVT